MSLWSKVKRAATSGVKTITKPLAVPVNIVKDVKDKGLKKGLKAIPSRIHVDAIKGGIDFTADTARVFAKEGTKVDRLAVKAIEGGEKLQTWTQRRPIQTMVGAAAAGAAGYGAFIAAPAALGGTSVAAGAKAAAVAGGKYAAGLAVATGAKYARTAVGGTEKPATSDAGPATTNVPANNPDGLVSGTAGLGLAPDGLVSKVLRLAFPGIV